MQNLVYTWKNNEQRSMLSTGVLISS